MIPNISTIYDRHHRATPTHPGSVVLQIAGGGKRVFVSTGVKVLPKQWDGKRGCVKNHDHADQLNAAIIEFRKRVYDLLLAQGDHTNVSDIPRLLKDGVTPTSTFTDYIARRIELRRIDEATKKRYRGWLAVFREWGGMTYFHDITAPNIRAYNEWACKRRGMDGGEVKQGTLYNYNAALRSFINDAVADELVESNPYSTKRIRIPNGAKRHVDTLTPEQVRRLEELDLHAQPKIERVRDCFLLQCYTGLAYSDLAQFDIATCQHTGGELVKRGYRQKTKTEYVFILLPKAKSILDKYGGRAPLPTNQKYNDYLKVLGSMIGYENLHSHCGRASCATLMRNAGLPMSVIQRVLGHNTITQTERYASMIDATIIEAMKSLE